MDVFTILAILITLAATFSYVNHRYIGLPITIGVMVITLVLSLMLNLLGSFGFGLEQRAATLLRSIDFDRTVLHGMLSFLLFAGALHVDINDLMELKWSIGVLATVGTLISTFLVGTLTWVVVGWLGIGLSYLYCLLFGALISPTDPIAVLGILKTAHAPKSLEMRITGESLFNDGVGIVIFLVMLEMVTGTHGISAALPLGPERDVILAITYTVVIFSIIVQGLTLEKFVKLTILPQKVSSVGGGTPRR